MNYIRLGTFFSRLISNLEYYIISSSSKNTLIQLSKSEIRAICPNTLIEKLFLFNFETIVISGSYKEDPIPHKRMWNRTNMTLNIKTINKCVFITKIHIVSDYESLKFSSYINSNKRSDTEMKLISFEEEFKKINNTAKYLPFKVINDPSSISFKNNIYDNKNLTKYVDNDLLLDRFNFNIQMEYTFCITIQFFGIYFSQINFRCKLNNLGNLFTDILNSLSEINKFAKNNYKDLFSFLRKSISGSSSNNHFSSFALIPFEIIHEKDPISFDYSNKIEISRFSLFSVKKLFESARKIYNIITEECKIDDNHKFYQLLRSYLMIIENNSIRYKPIYLTKYIVKTRANTLKYEFDTNLLIELYNLPEDPLENKLLKNIIYSLIYSKKLQIDLEKQLLLSSGN